jgi:Glutathione peroxidase
VFANASVDVFINDMVSGIDRKVNQRIAAAERNRGANFEPAASRITRGQGRFDDSNMTTNTSLYEIPVERIDGAAATLKEHSGEVLLVVNVASKCGLTPQYEGLEALQKKFSGAKFSVLGFPANDFAGQEPGSNADIQQFCTTQFSVTFSRAPYKRVKGRFVARSLSAESSAARSRSSKR